MTYGREEILEGLSVDQAEVHAAEHPSERVLAGVLETVPGTTDLFFLAAVRNDDAVLGHLPLLLGEPPGVLWPIW
jgi:hypothetical protein